MGIVDITEITKEERYLGGLFFGPKKLLHALTLPRINLVGLLLPFGKKGEQIKGDSKEDPKKIQTATITAESSVYMVAPDPLRRPP
jgi:hypothetical protein